MISARAETQFAHAYLPRDLHKLFRAAGLTVGDVTTLSIVETRYDPSSYGASVIGTTRDQALKQWPACSRCRCLGTGSPLPNDGR